MDDNGRFGRALLARGMLRGDLEGLSVGGDFVDIDIEISKVKVFGYDRSTKNAG